MISGSIARRYARALLAIGMENKEYEQYGAQLERTAEVLANKDLSEVLANPSLAQSKRKAMLEEIISRMKLSPLMRNFLLLLQDRNRIEFLPAIVREFQVMADEHAGRIRANVLSANPLDPSSISRLKTAIEKKTGKQVLLQQETDAELIAGMVTKIGSIVYDGSIRTRLQQMRQTLIEGQR